MQNATIGLPRGNPAPAQDEAGSEESLRWELGAGWRRLLPLEVCDVLKGQVKVGSKEQVSGAGFLRGRARFFAALRMTRAGQRISLCAFQTLRSLGSLIGFCRQNTWPGPICESRKNRRVPTPGTVRYQLILGARRSISRHALCPVQSPRWLWALHILLLRAMASRVFRIRSGKRSAAELPSRWVAKGFTVDLLGGEKLCSWNF
jgi:hypothetical protein